MLIGAQRSMKYGGNAMHGIAIRWLTLTGAVIITSYLIDGIVIQGFLSAFFAAAALGVFNAFFRPIAIILTLPINILSLGLFTFIINAVMLKMASGIIPGFDVIGFWAAVIGSLVISIALLGFGLAGQKQSPLRDGMTRGKRGFVLRVAVTEEA